MRFLARRVVAQLALREAKFALQRSCRLALQATVKAMTPEAVRANGCTIILGNTIT